MINVDGRLDKIEGMFFVKFVKLFNTLRPFFAEIFLPGESDKDKVAKSKTLTVITIIVALNLFLFTNKIFVFNPPWSREEEAKKEGQAQERGSPNEVWLDFLEDQLKDHVNEITELENRLAESEAELDTQSELNEELKREIQSLKAKISLLKNQIEKGASSRDIYERLKELEDSKDVY